MGVRPCKGYVVGWKGNGRESGGEGGRKGTRHRKAGERMVKYSKTRCKFTVRELQETRHQFTNSTSDVSLPPPPDQLLTKHVSSASGTQIFIYFSFIPPICQRRRMGKTRLCYN